MVRHTWKGRARKRNRRRVTVVVLVTVAVTAVNLAMSTCNPPLLGSNDGGDTEWPGWGFTHTQFSADDGDSRAVATAEEAIKALPRMVQAQHIMGWGAGNPEPSPGLYDFHSLDRRMEFIRRTGGIPVITLCCAPDWMKGGEPGETDWDQIWRLRRSPNTSPTSPRWPPQSPSAIPYVRHFIVWNEFKGFFDDERGRWDAKGYTDLYNAVYDALKAVNPGNQVGGPYLDFSSVPLSSPNSSPFLQGSWGAVDQRVIDAFTYWNLNRRGADFAVVDGHATTDDGASDEFAALEKFAAVGEWLRGQVEPAHLVV